MAETWWVWLVALFAISFVIGVVAVVAGVGGGVLFVPIVSGFFPFHLDFVRGVGLVFALAGTLAAGPSLLRNRLAQNRLMRRFCDERGIPLLDTTDALTARFLDGDNVYFPDESHLNETGHAVVADALAGYLRLPARVSR